MVFQCTSELGLHSKQDVGFESEVIQHYIDAKSLKRTCCTGFFTSDAYSSLTRYWYFLTYHQLIIQMAKAMENLLAAEKKADQ